MNVGFNGIQVGSSVLLSMFLYSLRAPHYVLGLATAQALPADKIFCSHRTKLWPLPLIGKGQALCLLLTDD